MLLFLSTVQPVSITSYDKTQWIFKKSVFHRLSSQGYVISLLINQQYRGQEPSWCGVTEAAASLLCGFMVD